MPSISDLQIYDDILAAIKGGNQYPHELIKDVDHGRTILNVYQELRILDM